MNTEKTNLEAETPALSKGDVTSSYFKVNGAGNVVLSEKPNWKCGGEKGFSFDVSWGRHGLIGGVMPKEEARRMAEFILNALK